MIINFKQSYLEEFWNTGEHKRVPSHLKDRLSRKLDMLNAASELLDLRSPPSNHLHPLHGDREGQWAISVSGDYVLNLETVMFTMLS
jgi:proteic killer suppression protein